MYLATGEMEYLGDGEGTNGNRGLAVSTAGGDDAFAGAVVAAVEDAQRESAALVHYIGREVSECVLWLLVVSKSFRCCKVNRCLFSSTLIRPTTWCLLL